MGKLTGRRYIAQALDSGPNRLSWWVPIESYEMLALLRALQAFMVFNACAPARVERLGHGDAVEDYVLVLSPLEGVAPIRISIGVSRRAFGATPEAEREARMWWSPDIDLPPGDKYGRYTGIGQRARDQLPDLEKRGGVWSANQPRLFADGDYDTLCHAAMGLEWFLHWALCLAPSTIQRAYNPATKSLAPPRKYRTAELRRATGNRSVTLDDGN